MISTSERKTQYRDGRQILLMVAFLDECRQLTAHS